MIKFLALLTPLFLGFSFTQSQSLDNEIQQAFLTNNSKLLAKHFSNTLNLSISKEQYTTTKYQAELLVSEFLKNNPITEIKKVSGKSESENNRYYIYQIKSNRKNYKILAKLIDHKNNNYISDLRIE